MRSPATSIASQVTLRKSEPREPAQHLVRFTRADAFKAKLGRRDEVHQAFGNPPVDVGNPKACRRLLLVVGRELGRKRESEIGLAAAHNVGRAVWSHVVVANPDRLDGRCVIVSRIRIASSISRPKNFSWLAKGHSRYSVNCAMKARPLTRLYRGGLAKVKPAGPIRQSFMVKATTPLSQSSR